MCAPCRLLKKPSRTASRPGRRIPQASRPPLPSVRSQKRRFSKEIIKGSPWIALEIIASSLSLRLQGFCFHFKMKHFLFGKYFHCDLFFVYFNSDGFWVLRFWSRATVKNLDVHWWIDCIHVQQSFHLSLFAALVTAVETADSCVPCKAVKEAETETRKWKHVPGTAMWMDSFL